MNINILYHIWENADLRVIRDMNNIIKDIVYSMGVVAIAEIEKRIGNKVISFEIYSDGIYGIESDAEDYIEEIDQKN